MVLSGILFLCCFTFFKADRLRQLSIMFQMERPALSFQLLKNSRKLCRLLLRIPASKFRADVPEIQCQIFSIAYNPVRADPASSRISWIRTIYSNTEES